MKVKRNSSIELLRIICMCFVIGLHVILQYKNDGIGSSEYYISNILRCIFVCAVNCFVIISGYFGIKFNIKKLMKMSMQVSFYCIVIYLITLVLGIHRLNIKNDILLFLPIITKQYWYITIYFVLCIISPLLNIIVDNLDKNQFKIMLGMAFGMFYLLPTINYGINAPTITGDCGYGIVNFICLYFLGRYIKLYYKDNKSKLFYGIGFIMSALGLFLANHILTLIFGFYFNSFISYDTVFLVASAFMLFMLFKNIEFESKIINDLAKYALVAFLIHVHPTFVNYLFNNILNIQSYAGVGYIASIFIIPIVIYFVSWSIEWIRVKLLGKLEDNIINKILKMINKFIVKDKSKVEFV